MIQPLILVIVLAMTLMTTACSFFASFVLVNESEESVTVRYYAQRTEAIPFPSLRCEVTTVQRFEADKQDFDNCLDGTYEFSEDHRSARVRLESGHVLRMVSLDVRDISDEPVFKTGMRMIFIEGQLGSVSYEGDQVYEQFAPGPKAWFPNAPGLYTLTYK